MKETPTNWTAERNEVKNRVISHLEMCYNLEKNDWEIILNAIDSVFFFEDEILEEDSISTKNEPQEIK